jgi:hypothetical protein
MDFPEDAHAIGSRGIVIFPLGPFFSASLEFLFLYKNQLNLQR